MSDYPSISEVETADRKQLAHWYRFLPSPGESAERFENYALQEQIRKSEEAILARITERFTELGGFTPSISKSIGWMK